MYSMNDNFDEFFSGGSAGYVISHPSDIYYLSGFYSEDCLLLMSASPVLVTDSRYTVAARVSRFPVHISDGSYIDGVKALAHKQELKELFVQGDRLTYNEFMSLSGEFTVTAKEFRPLACRRYKTDEELLKIKAAQNITDKAFEKLLDYILPGVTEKELKAQLEYLMLSLGADGFAFETIVASGKNGAKPHAVPTDKKVEKGEFITFDFGARLDNYNSDMTRTVVLGEPDKEMAKVYSTVLQAHIEARDLLRCGASGQECDNAAREVISKNGYGEYFTHSLGHGVGIDIHEAPRLSRKSTDILDVGDIVTVEPGIYIENLLGVRIENMYAINRNGYENLTVSDKNLIKL